MGRQGRGGSMNNCRTVQVDLGDRSYPIYIGRNTAPELLFPLISGRKVLMVTDSNVEKYHAEKYLAAFRETADVTLFTYDAGEQSKHLGTVEKICRAAVAAGLDRSSVFIALGGGVCGDMTGLAASLYMRGTRYIQIPTTLLAMVDSSVGGKTGVDLPEGKNLVGAFFQPQAVLMDIENLRTLPVRELSNGLAEMVKTAVILDGALFEQLESSAESLLQLSETAPLAETIGRCCELKAEVVSKDEKENGLRAILNYGHTFGHALEAVTGYETFAHGEGVAIGMCMAADLAVAMGLFTAEEALRQETLLQKFQLPVRAEGLALVPDKLLQSMMHDKKTSGGKLKLILSDRIGHADIFKGIGMDMIAEALCSRI